MWQYYLDVTLSENVQDIKKVNFMWTYAEPEERHWFPPEKSPKYRVS